MSVVVLVDLNIFNSCYSVYQEMPCCLLRALPMLYRIKQYVQEGETGYWRISMGGQAQYNVMVSQTILILLQSNTQCCAARNRQVACKAYLISLWSSTMFPLDSTMGADFAFDKLAAPTCSTCADAGSSASNTLFMLPDIECMVKGLWYVLSTHKLQN